MNVIMPKLKTMIARGGTGGLDDRVADPGRHDQGLVP
jgi:hypothetical protein